MTAHKEREVDAESQVLWQSDDGEHAFTVGDMYRADQIEGAIRTFLAEREDGIDSAEERFFEACDDLEIFVNPCPMCGRYSAHGHSFE